MRTITISSIKRTFSFILLTYVYAAATSGAFGQEVKVQPVPEVDPQIKVEVNSADPQQYKVQVNPQVRVQVNLDHLAARAKKMVDVNIDGPMLDLARSVLDDKDPEEKKAKEAISGLKGIHVRVFEFDGVGGYSPADLEAIRAQFRGPAWRKMIGVVSRNGGDNAEVYTNLSGTQVVGIAVVVAEPRELTFVNIIGPIDVGKLRDLGGTYGIPGVTIKINAGRAKPDDKDDDDNDEDNQDEEDDGDKDDDGEKKARTKP